MPTSSLALVSAAFAAAVLSHPPVSEIIEKSVITNNRDWNAQDDFAYAEQNVKSKVDGDGTVKRQGSKTHTVLMIEGSPYRQLIRVDGKPLGPDAQEEEEAKLMRVMTDRHNESAGQRESRTKKYRDQRAEEHLLMEQMSVAFNFRLLGQEIVDGVPCFHLQALPKPDYQPPVEKARVLKGMRGQMWIDQREFHWVKVKAEVIEPVSFGFFIAKVNPGTSFELDQMPLGSSWLPKRFVQSVNASVFGLYGIRSLDEFHYSDYKPLTSLNSRMIAMR